MAQRAKIDSNVTGLRYADEQSPGILVANPVWRPLEPNSYADFGASVTTVARNPINPSRQRKKGVVTDLDASGGFTTDMTQENLQRLNARFFYADFRAQVEFNSEAAPNPVTNVDGTGEDFEAASGLDAFNVDDLVFAAGFTNAANNGLHVVTIAAAASLTVASDLVDEAAPPATATLTQVGVQGQAGDLDVDVTGSLPAITSTLLDFTTYNLFPGSWIFVGGDTAATAFTNPENNGFKRIRTVAANRIEFDKTREAMVAEASTTETVQLFFGRAIRNEGPALFVRRTQQLERTLGQPDDATSDDQAEYLLGALPSIMTFNIPTANKLTVDLEWIANEGELLDERSLPAFFKNQAIVADAIKSQSVNLGSTAPAITEADAFNTSSDFTRIRMAEVVPGNPAPTPLFVFLTDITITFDNSLSPEKAVSVLGNCGVSVGTFAVSLDATAYFSSVGGPQAVQDNADITIDMAVSKANSGWVLDLPLLSLGDARPDIVQDQSIRLPLTGDAATAAKVDSNLDYTAQITYYDYLPDLADT